MNATDLLRPDAMTLEIPPVGELRAPVIRHAGESLIRDLDAEVRAPACDVAARPGIAGAAEELAAIAAIVGKG